ncbi:MAG: hypothetical protein WCG80_07795 [Spirochaetales bacterium]
MNPHETLTYNEPARKVVPDPAGHVLIYPSTLPNTVVLNMTNAIQVDGTGAGWFPAPRSPSMAPR